MLLVAVKLGTVPEPVRKSKKLLNNVPVPFFVLLFPLFLNRIQVD
jgi:hypothetical protein